MKILKIDCEECVGCKDCELACSLEHTGEFNPASSRIRNFVFLEEAFKISITCFQCDEPFCVMVCPAVAITKDETTGALLVSKERCVGCNACLLACPFGNIIYSNVECQAIKCDLCGGEPACVAFCPTGALEYTEAETVVTAKKEALATKLKEAYKGLRF